FVDAFDLVKNLARLNHRHPIFGRAFSFPHASLRRLFRHWLVGKHANPDFAAALDVTSHRDARCLDLAIREPGRLEAWHSILTEADGAAASGGALHASAHLLAVLTFFRHQHGDPSRVQSS